MSLMEGKGIFRKVFLSYLISTLNTVVLEPLILRNHYDFGSFKLDPVLRIYIYVRLGDVGPMRKKEENS